MLTILVFALCLMLFTVGVSEAAPMGTAITYQGRLMEEGQPADGPYDFEFKLFDANEGGAQKGAAIDVNDLDVIEGYFSVALDFGSNVFDGNSVWLEVTVMQADGSDPCTLMPRHELTPVPYALHTRGIFVDSAGRVGIRTKSPERDLHIVDTSYAEIELERTKDPANKWHISVDGDSLNFLETGVAYVLSLMKGGNVGICTANPDDNLHIENSAGDNSVKVRSVSNGESSLKLFEGSDYGFEFLYDGFADQLNLWSRKFAGNEDVRMSWLKNGNVGIGTASPVAKLHIQSSTGGLLASTTSSDSHAAKFSSTGGGLEGATVYADNNRLTGGIALRASNNSLSDSDATVVFKNAGSGPLMLGYGAGMDQHEFEVRNNGTVGIYNSGHNRTVEINASESGRITLSNGSGAGSAYLLGGVNDGGAMYLKNGTGGATIEMYGDYLGNGAGSIEVSNDSGATTAYVGGGINDGGAIYLKNGAGSSTIELYGDYAGTNRGRVVTNALQITGGSDLSEQFEISGPEECVQPGMVVCIDPSRPGKLMVSGRAYDKKVAGIISGAGDLRPGMIMAQEGSAADGGQAVALTGRVFCRADASGGSIEPGDMLTTSETPGHAMKVTDYSRAQGAVLGKAMTSLESGKGLVLVLVTLQ